MRKLVLAAAFLATIPHAQICDALVSPVPEPDGIVIGRVFCGDASLPARLANVSLYPVNWSPEDMIAGLGRPRRDPVDIISVQAGLDGRYTFAHAVPGTYYVVASKVGCINLYNPLSHHQLDLLPDQERERINQAVPRVTVGQNSKAHVDIQLQRGATVSGTITYDDGAPARNIRVTLRSKHKDGQWRDAYLETMSLFTDDRGHFRLTSLLPGTYVLAAFLDLDINKRQNLKRFQTSTSPTAQSNIFFYGAGTPDIDQSVTLTLRSDEKLTNQNMSLPISKLHKLTGRVAAGAPGHFANSATVELISTTSGKTIVGTNIDEKDNFFRLELVPEGVYMLHITNVSDVGLYPGGVSFLKSYGDVDMPLIFRRDMLNIIATVPAK